MCYAPAIKQIFLLNTKKPVNLSFKSKNEIIKYGCQYQNYNLSIVQLENNIISGENINFHFPSII